MTGKRSGSILLETILALLFVALTVGAIAGLFKVSLNQINQSELRTRAMLLADNKMAELETGLIDATESTEGDFAGKPDKFLWKLEFESTQVPELQRVKVSITHDDPNAGFTYSTIRLYSPNLNISAEKMKEIAADPVKMQALGGTSEGLSSLMSMIAEMPYGDKLVESLNRGGMFGLIGILNKAIGGKLSFETLLSSIEPGQSSNEAFDKMVADSMRVSPEDKMPAWTNFDTAGIGRSPWLASRNRSDNRTAGQNPATQPGLAANQPGPRTGQPAGQPTGNVVMTREEAIQRMQEMLRRLANQQQQQRK